MAHPFLALGAKSLIADVLWCIMVCSYKRGEWLAQVTKDFDLIAVSGTHGKKTSLSFLFSLFSFFLFLPEAQDLEQGRAPLLLLIRH